jgi:translation initiation factor IF-3
MRTRPVRQEDPTRINERIRVPEVRLIGADGQQIGVVSSDQARMLAQRAGLDLVEVSPNVKPPVCRIMDYGKYKFELQKKARASKAKQQVVKIKEIKLHPKTDDNDFNYRVKHAIGFLQRGFKVKVALVFRGREMAHVEVSRPILDRFAEQLTAEAAVIESRPPMEGNSMFIIFAPSAKSLAVARKRAQALAAQGKSEDEDDDAIDRVEEQLNRSVVESETDTPEQEGENA